MAGSPQLQYDPIDVAFQSAMQDFKTDIANDDLYSELLKTRSIDDVYDATDALQAKPGHLRHLSKIESFLLGMKEYASVIEQFVQAKPDMLALIWAPIKLILQWTNTLKQALDAVVNAIADIGARLPEFQKFARLFTNSDRIKDLLLLFFKDILDFYAIALKFFSLSRWKYFFEAVWPRHREKISIVISHIDRHTLLMRNEVRLEHIQEEHSARLRALQHFDSTEKEQRRQAYRSIKADVAPRDFSRDLDRLHGSLCKDTAMWLTRNSTFKLWSSPSNPETKWLWLHGIPGAGKTFLASAVIEELKVNGSVAFAFLSYRQSEQTGPLDIVFSLIFQLSAGSERLREVVCQSFNQSSRSSLKDAIRLLVEVINCSGLTYLVIDGLDEIDSNKSSRLISSMQQVAEQCSEVKVLISSRADDAIKQRLKDSAVLRVDQNNLETIQSFISSRSKRWYAEQNFTQDTVNEIEALLKPLAAKSKGMFLYAKLILDNISAFDHIEEIRAELRVLPEELDDVYRRALDRVNCLKPESLMRKARKILGWTACAPTPLTIQELEHAVLINTEDSSDIKTVSNALNVVKVCGPVIEIIDDYVSLVHFSFKEYLLSPKVAGSVKRPEALLSLSLCCLTYLSQEPHDKDSDDHSMAQNILSGVYRLNRYATVYWYEIIEMYLCSMESNDLDRKIIERLYEFKSSREQMLTNGEQATHYSEKLQCLRNEHSDLYNWLCAVSKFRSTYLGSNLKASRARSQWLDADPTTLSSVSYRIYQRLDSMLCKGSIHYDCQCPTLRTHFGVRLFQCSIPGCPYHRHGFDNRDEILSHLRAHVSPWKCRNDACTTQEKFLSRQMRDMHESLYHEQSTAAYQDLQKLSDLNSYEEAIDILDYAVTSNDLPAVMQLLDHMETSGIVKGTNAAFRPTTASADIIRELLRPFTLRMIDVDYILTTAKKEGNLEVIKAVFRKAELTRLYGDHQILSCILITDPEYFEPEVTDFFNTHRGNIRVPLVDALQYDRTISAASFEKAAVMKLLSWWKASDILKIPDLRKDNLLRAISSRCPCKELCEAVVNSGASLRHPNTKIRSALFLAASSSSKSAAELMVYLLEQGADPNVDFKGVKPGEMEGAKNIQKWTGKTWDQHVEETKKV